MLPVLIVTLLDMKGTSDRSGQCVLNYNPKNPNPQWSAANCFLLPEYREQIFYHSCVTMSFCKVF